MVIKNWLISYQFLLLFLNKWIHDWQDKCTDGKTETSVPDKNQYET